MTNNQKMKVLEIFLNDFESYLYEQGAKDGNDIHHKFVVQQISKSTYILEFHYDKGLSVEKNQFLSFQDPLNAKHYIQALFNLMTINQYKYHESTMFEVIRTLTNKQI